MAENNLSFKTAFKKFLDLPPDSIYVHSPNYGHPYPNEDNKLDILTSLKTNEPTGIESPLKKSEASEKQMKQANTKSVKKKFKKNRKEINEAEVDFYEKFTPRRFYRNIHSSGDVYSAADAYLEENKEMEKMSPYWQHPIIDQPRHLLPVADPPRLPPPPPPPFPFDEPAWDDDFYF